MDIDTVILRKVLEAEFRHLEGKLKTQLEMVFPDIDPLRLDKIKNSVKEAIWNTYRDLENNVDIDCIVDIEDCSEQFIRRLNKNV
jgi:hypothetical protein